MEWHSFALLLTVPQGREAEWERLLRRTPVPSGMRCAFNDCTRLLVTVEAEMEFLAIEQAEQWVQSLAARALPPFSLGTNAQPENEIDL